MEIPVMETRNRVFGEEHPDMLRSMGNLASTYWNQGGIAAGCSSLGDDKGGPRGGTSRHADEHGKHHVDIHWKSGTVEGGRTTGGLYLRDESPLGPASRHAESTSNLAHTLYSQGQDEKAIALMKNAVNLLITQLGPLYRSSHLCSSIVI